MELFFFFSKLINLSAYCIRSKWEPLRFQSLIYEGVLTLDWVQCWINTMAWFCPINNQQSTAIINGLASLSIWSQFGNSSKLTFKVNTPCTWNCSSWFRFKTEFSWHNIDTAVLVVLKNKQEHYLNSLLERGTVAYESDLKLCFDDMDTFLNTFWKSMWKQVQTLRASLPVSFCYRWTSFELMIFQVQVSLLSCW